MTNPSPPRWAERFLSWYCSERFLEEVEGDLYEQFEKTCKARGIRAAKWQYIVLVFRFLRPFRLKAFEDLYHPFIYLPMFRNYWISTYRNLLRHKGFSLINILGLTIGMAACLLILRYVNMELNYDSFHEKTDRIYRLSFSHYLEGAFRGKNIYHGYGLGPEMREKLPEVEDFCRLHFVYNEAVFSYKNEADQVRSFREADFLYVDSSFLNIFSYPLLRGDRETALSSPQKIVITKQMAEKYFGADDPIGKNINVNGARKDGLFEVSGVLANLPANTHLKFDALMPMQDLLGSRQYQQDNGWGWFNFNTYISVQTGADTMLLAQKIDTLLSEHTGEDDGANGAFTRTILQTPNDIHLTTDIPDEPTPTVSKTNIYFFGLIAIFILIIAWVNYMNLSTARAIERSKEVGIRKAIGAHRGQLIRQFLFESLFVNILALGLAILLAEASMPYINELIGKDISTADLSNRTYLGALVILFFGGAMLSGFYPAIVLSSFKPVSVLKGTFDNILKGVSIRKALVVFQFAATLALIVGTFAVYQQIMHMKQADLGMNLEQIIVVKGPRIWDADNNDFRQAVQTMKGELLQFPSIEKVATARAVPGEGYNWGARMRKLGDPVEKNQAGSVVFVDFDFIETYEIEVLAGRPISENYGLGQSAVMVNETTIKSLGIENPEDAIEQKLYFGGDTIKILTVLKDFGWNSVKEQNTSFILAPTYAGRSSFCIRVNTTNIPDVLQKIESVYSELFPGNPFTYQFQDDYFNRQYQEDQKFGNFFGIFAFLAIFIACLGLFGLASFTASRRIREIGIRKVLGASISELMLLISKDFLVLILIANVIGLPLAYYFISQWLENFALRIDLSLWIFLIPSVLVLLIAMVTISYQTILAARTNPVEAIRHE